MPLVSVLVSTRDRPDTLRRCLASVAAQDRPPDEVLVLDDGSTPPLDSGGVRAWEPGLALRCLRSETPLGVAGARNRLMHEARGDVFVVLDDDAVLSWPGCLSSALTALEAAPGIGVLAFRIVNHGPSGTEVRVPFRRLTLRRHPQVADTPARVSYFIGTGHAITRRVIDECGGYPDDLYFADEELDLSYRAVAAGFELLYVPQAQVDHTPQMSAIDAAGGRTEFYYRVRNRFVLAYRHLPWRHLVVHALVWLARFTATAAVRGRWRELGAGLRDAARRLPTAGRAPLPRAAVRYLRANHGRLWY